ncbi:hypothetical protein ABIC73_004408 [Prescottella equi]|uniref:hypothetical protein n=1 Tax=Rhodococcus hoagii TaxID=43767 RepID=UPI003398FD16
MNAFTWIGLALLIVGGGIVIWVSPMVLALQAKGLPGGRYRTRHGIGLGLAAFGAILMNIGTLSSSAGVAMKIAAVAAAVILLGTLLWATVRMRNQSGVTE